jgi:hypothetical protein
VPPPKNPQPAKNEVSHKPTTQLRKTKRPTRKPQHNYARPKTNTETTTQLRKNKNQHANHNTTTQEQKPTRKPQHNYARPTTNTQTTTQLRKTNNQHANHNTTTQSQMQTNASRSCGVGTTRYARVHKITPGSKP